MFEKLKQEMQRQHIKAYSLAKKADISTSDIYAALRGDRPFYPNWRRRIATALNVPEEQLFESEESEVR